MAFNWTCLYCNRPQSVTEHSVSEGEIFFYVGKTISGPIGMKASAIACSNPDCLEVTIATSLHLTGRYANGSPYFNPETNPFLIKRLMPESSAKPQSECIPTPLVEDYVEACKIRNLSPKASATLSRRCLQGMIRDFCKISKPTLFKEIESLKAAVEQGSSPKGVTEESVEAIDHVRGIGNIGAHMAKDINLIVPVEPEEAQLLIDLIEMLFEEWYVARETRSNKLARIKVLAEDKKQLIALQKKKE